MSGIDVGTPWTNRRVVPRLALCPRGSFRVARFVPGALLLLLVGVTACDSPSEPERDLPVLSAAALLTHLEFLAADSLFGRRTGSTHEVQAAQYIRDEFSKYGLQPAVPGYLQTFPIPVPVDGRTGLGSQNVLATIPGEGALAGQWLIVGAHYDHVGIGPPAGTDSIYNGADDNGSGTALLLEIARVLSDRFAAGGGTQARRSMMFQAYGAEEVGLVGSRYFCAQPTVPMDSIVAMVNIDMVGRLRSGGLTLFGISSSTDWAALVADANTRSLPLSLPSGLVESSDHWCFFEHARPVLFLHTGLHEQYHQPTDEVAFIDTEGIVNVGELAGSLLIDLAFRPERLSFAGGLSR